MLMDEIERNNENGKCNVSELRKRIFKNAKVGLNSDSRFDIKI